MQHLLVESDELVFEPSAGWSWAGGWNGRVPLQPPPRSLFVSSGGHVRPVALPQDLEQAFQQLTGRAYQAQGFNTPGMVRAQRLIIQPGTTGRCWLVGTTETTTGQNQGLLQRPVPQAAMVPRGPGTRS